jgi:hypothetical protein
MAHTSCTHSAPSRICSLASLLTGYEVDLFKKTVNYMYTNVGLQR